MGERTLLFSFHIWIHKFYENYTKYRDIYIATKILDKDFETKILDKDLKVSSVVKTND
jgi:hypothetical protein